MLRPRPIGPIPQDTARVAQALFPEGHPYLRLADELGDLFSDEIFAPLFPTRGQPALAPWRLALVTILQFAEDLSDQQAAHALRTRIDWKHVARLELTDRGFDGSVLSEFRGRLLHTETAQRLLTQADLRDLPRGARLTCARCGSASLISVWSEGTPYAAQGMVPRRRRRRQVAANL